MISIKLGDCKFMITHTRPDYEVDVLVKGEVNYLPVGSLIFTEKELEAFLSICIYKIKNNLSVSDFVWRYARTIAA